jgi:hypothetical protein
MYRLEQQTLCTDTSSDSVYDGKRNKNVHTFSFYTVLFCLLYSFTVCTPSDNLLFCKLPQLTVENTLDILVLLTTSSSVKRGFLFKRRVPEPFTTSKGIYNSRCRLLFRKVSVVGKFWGDFLSHQNKTLKLMFIIRVKRELNRVYRNGCRYNERLNTETGGSKTPHIHWVTRVNIQ